MDNIESIINTAVADAGDIAPAGDTSTSTEAIDTSGGGGNGGTTQQPPVVDAAVKTPVVDDDPFAKEYGLTARRADGKDNRIPYPRVKAISDNQVKKVVVQLAKELGISKAEAELKLEDVIGEIGTRKSKFGDFEKRISNYERIDQLAATNGDEYIKLLAQIAPDRYQKFADWIQNPPQAVAQKGVVDAANDPEPEPDYPIKDAQGNVIGLTFSLEGQKKREAWIERKLQREFQRTLDDRFKPLDEQRAEAAKKEKDRLAAEAFEKEATDRVKRRIDRVTKRHGWAEHSEAIKKAVVEKGMDIDDAYYDTVIPALMAERSKMRADILAELKGAPASTSTTVNTPPNAGGKPQSIEDIINASIAGVKAA